jgi:lipoprotein NlpD
MKAAIVSAALLLVACSNLGYENSGSASSASSAGTRASSTRGAVPDAYVVRAGDTLYSIAFRYGLDQREIATWNNLRNPNQIVAGQRLVLRSPGGGRSSTAATNSGSRPATSSGGSASPPARAATPTPRSTAARPDWQWPTSGTVVARYGEHGVLSTGIGIAGTLGQDIVASAPGRVVYSGNGLPDYGQLVIIEHNETWLSAYGHNQRVLVSQGALVARGQRIAEMGPGPGGTPRLHFEIRRNGDPQDPVPMLPGRR